ncbi:unnamed protein product [Cylindrotheca closterium]|uniref:L-ornithine N(5)-oxygenase n=1 Tax=Cylindrotheca closterium TaxID=2856 RepID=A0AAD2FYE8_9STRA|nr:unnamed protein product [Cylindrotheca closterium]
MHGVAEQSNVEASAPLHQSINEEAQSECKDQITTSDDSPPVIIQKELVMIGAGPHALTLMLRLIEPDPDLEDEKSRHEKMDFLSKMRPMAHVRRHIKEFQKGSAHMLKQKTKRKKSKDGDQSPSIPASFVKENFLVVDASADEPCSLHGWMGHWQKNFEIMEISQLRSPIAAHADPYDHRTLELYAEAQGRKEELIMLPHIPRKYGRWDFHGPFNAPSTKLFRDMHRKLIEAYGVDELVLPGRVKSIQAKKCPTTGSPLYILSIALKGGTRMLVETPRLVSAMGPSPPKNLSMPWLKRVDAAGCILHARDIVPFIQASKQQPQYLPNGLKATKPLDILVVGGGITSAHLCIVGARQGHSVTLAQRSPTLVRQFDVEDVWMGPARGKLLDKFHSEECMVERAKALREARKGGSMNAEMFAALQKNRHVTIQEELEIADVVVIEADDVDEDGRRAHRCLVWFDDGSDPVEFDQIWLATGFTHSVNNTPVLKDLCDQLPFATTPAGMPILNSDLSWKLEQTKDNECNSDGRSSAIEQNETEDDEVEASSNLWIMGPLAGLTLGPDALNLMGARHGAVRIAKSLRNDPLWQDLATEES